MKQLVKLFGMLLIVMSLSSCGYNSMVDLDEEVGSTWAQVENTYQRRADLIPNLVNVVKGAADYEKGTLTAVIEARSKATSIQLSADALTPENIKKFEAVQSNLTGALSRLLATFERYPDLKANSNFQSLMVELEGSENRISTARRDFNESVQGYNSYVRKIPNNITAGVFGFKKKGYFESEGGADQVPEVQF